jgi:hydrogenase maturation protein HypF
MPPTPESIEIARVRVTASGIVQGVGFRPFIYNRAIASRLTGTIGNEANRVLIELQGPAATIDSFLETVRSGPPPAARIESLEVESINPIPDESSFQIIQSASDSTIGPTIPADLATCPDCLAEINDPTQRRFRYPFTNCTNCGPRWSIVDGLPYDRPKTSMARFPLCDDCRREYEDPTDRRFHAQPIACSVCGPRLQILSPSTADPIAGDDAAIIATVEAILAGQIVALKGLGGFQLICDATVDQPVNLLRQRKCRPAKPLALLVRDTKMARDYCQINDEEASALESVARPILLLRKRPDPAGPLAKSVAPGQANLGIMLPCTPLHHLLIDALDRPVVCTSGNLSEEPIVIKTADALERLGSIADRILTHNRPIVRPVDDSVARWLKSGLQILRRARGYAPRPIQLGRKGPTILATGAHLKNTVALSLGDQVVISSHIGDLETIESVRTFHQAVDDLVGFFDIVPERLACDLHPDYASTTLAEKLAQRWNVPLLQFQHHHAHVAAVMAEKKLEGPLLGIAFDGTGYGTDATVWGGEALVCEENRFKRLAHLQPFPLPGGDQATRDPRRSMLGLIREMLPEQANRLAREAGFSDLETESLLTMIDKKINSPMTSSVGRLFDAVAALTGIDSTVTYEGQAAINLETTALNCSDRQSAYPLNLSNPQADRPIQIDPTEMLQAILNDRVSGVGPEKIARRFHNWLAQAVLKLAQNSQLEQIVLCGGCFQNRLLLDKSVELLSQAGFQPIVPHQVPPGDGSIALGQAWLAGWG